MGRSKEAILAEVAREEQRLADLESALAEARAKRERLQSELEAASSTTYPVLPLSFEETSKAPGTPSDKVKLFRSLFRGRTDLFPTRFVSKKTGKAGYAPECSNKVRAGLCILRTGGKCSECPNQAFSPVSDHVILDHLQGRRVMGVYPMLEDETCWLLAADFDKSSWKEDVAAFAETCRIEGIPVAIERSRSGNGAHAWFFFTAPVRANLARRMGCYLITETMSRRHELSMESYDRLFPNQDTMPRGGFGNLIALPLQYEARKQGNSVFVDERFEPFSNQWAFLATVPRLEPAAVEAVAKDAARTEQVVGVRFAEVIDEEEMAAPWCIPPSRRPRLPRVEGLLPAEVAAVLEQRLFVEKAGLPSQLLSQLKRLAAFQNPEFYKRQKLRLSTLTTPRVVACFEEQPRVIALPRGCLSEAEALFRQLGAKLVPEDRRQHGTPVKFRFDGD